MSDKNSDLLKEQLQEWLNERGLTLADVITEGDTYCVMIEQDDGTFSPEYLPDQFQEMTL